MARSGAKIKGTDLNFDPEFRFLLELDPDFEPWRQLAAEWLTQQTSDVETKRISLTKFFVRYLHVLKLDKSPEALFRQDVILPDMWAALELGNISEIKVKRQHDIISDFLDWVLRTHLAELDQEGHRVVPTHLGHPFPRVRPKGNKIKGTGVNFDPEFRFLLELDPAFEPWRKLAAEWWAQQTSSKVDPFVKTIVFLF